MNPKILFSFPGQGSQRAGMLDQLPDRDFYEEAVQSSLGFNLEQLNDETLQAQNAITQAALLVDGVSHARYLIEKGLSISFTAGLSIGAYPAAVIAGVLELSDALKMVYRRGQLMQSAYPRGYGLTAIIGLDLSAVEDICAQVGDTYIANYNAEDQIVIAGSDERMAQAAERAQTAGATRCVRIKITVPSHCALLDQAANTFYEEFKDIPVSRPKFAYISGSTGRVLWSGEKIREDLIFNMCRRTQWREAMVSAYQRGCRVAVEMPPGHALTSLTKKAFDDGLVLSYEELGAQEILDQIALRA